MFESLCLAGMLFGSFWVANSRTAVVPDGGTVLGGSRSYPAYTRTESGPPILSKIPYVNRLVRTVGYQAPVVPDESTTPLPEKPTDHRVPILPPIKPGERPTCDDPPSEQEIFRAMPRASRGVSYIYEEFRDDIEITKEKLVDRIDPPRFFPLIGPAQLHHCNWKCTVSYTETVDSYFPVPFRTKRRRAEVVYIDKDHLHLCGSGNPQAVFQDMTVPQNCPAGGTKAIARKPAILAGQTEESEPARKPAIVRRNDMSIADVVRMNKKGIAQDIILRQMELTNAVFNLSVDDIIELHDAGVSEAIIRAMQERRTGNTTGASDSIQRREQMMIDSENLRRLQKEVERFWRNDQPSHLTPYRIHGGVGPASSSK